MPWTAHRIVTPLLDLDFSFWIGKVLIVSSVGTVILNFPKNSFLKCQDAAYNKQQYEMATCTPR